jgi:hypothetical protein
MADFWDFLSDIAPDVFNLTANYLGVQNSTEAAREAAAANAAAANRAGSLQSDNAELVRSDTAPYRDVGKNALYSLASLNNVEYDGAPGTMQERGATALSRFQTSPGYDFQQTEGRRAVEASQAAKGKLYSGETLRRTQEVGQGLANAEYGTYSNRLSSLAGTGQTGVSQYADVGTAAASNQGNAARAAGSANASAYTGSANSQNQGINNLLYWYGRGKA